MKISGITPKSFVQKETKTSKSEKTGSSSKIEDKLEISNEAKLMSKEVKNEALIRERMANKFYDSDEVIDSVAKAILKDLDS